MALLQKKDNQRESVLSDAQKHRRMRSKEREKERNLKASEIYCSRWNSVNIDPFKFLRNKNHNNRLWNCPLWNISNNELKTGNDKFCVIVKWTEFIVEARMRQFACNFQLGKSKQTLFIDCNRILSSGDEHRENALKFGLERRIGYGEGCDGRVAMATAITYCEWKTILFFYFLQGEISKWTK